MPWVLLLAALWTFTADALSPICLNVLATAGYTDSDRRTEIMSRLTKRYKNDARFAAWYETATNLPTDHDQIFSEFARGGNTARLPPKRVDLSADPKVLDAEVQYLILPAIRMGDRRTGTEYEMRALTLRKGDTVALSDGEYVLGDFLGYGNQNQVFAIEGRPEEVIKIPTNVWFTNTAIRTKVVDSFVRMESKIPEGVPRVRVLKTGARNDYVIVSRIHGEENGDDFIKRVYRASPLDPQNQRRYQRLMEVAEKVTWAKYTRYPAVGAEIERRMYEDEAFQFVWDKKVEDWILADWEPLNQH